MNEAACLGCGCTDSCACPTGCSWELVDRGRQIGLCTRCADLLAVRLAMKRGRMKGERVTNDDSRATNDGDR